MSLTAEAYRERKWGPFPALRKALEDKQVPPNYYGFTSASDNMFDAMSRLIEIAVLTNEYENDIKAKAVSVGREDMYRDLLNLEEALENASRFFKRTSDKVRMLQNAL
ncbi:MAG: hypothetical protein GXY53_02545 [Desulfobulbus sp.]|nr:hypothetical protein [Desulfobulbus sp.]